MYRLGAVLLAVAAMGCSSDPPTVSTTAAASPPSTASTVVAGPTTTVPTIESCPPVPFRPLTVPDRAVGTNVDLGGLEGDPYMTIPGSAVDVWVDAEAQPVIAIVRGALPPEPWAGPTAQVEIMRTPAALGPLSGDRWGVAWFESDERCDLYTLVLYPPTSANEALEVAESLIPNR